MPKLNYDIDNGIIVFYDATDEYILKVDESVIKEKYIIESVQVYMTMKEEGVYYPKPVKLNTDPPADVYIERVENDIENALCEREYIKESPDIDSEIKADTYTKLKSSKSDFEISIDW